MIKAHINGEPVSIPTSWEELTFKQFIRVTEGIKDYAALIACLTGLDEDQIRKFSNVSGLEDILTATKFLNDPADYKPSYPMIGHHTLPKNFSIKLESLGQFEDMRATFAKTKKDETLADITRKYATYIAIYLQKIIDGEYNPARVPEVAEEVMMYPAGEVISLGSFFFLKLLNLSTGTKNVYQVTIPSQKKSRSGSRPSAKRSGHTRR